MVPNIRRERHETPLHIVGAKPNRRVASRRITIVVAHTSVYSQDLTAQVPLRETSEVQTKSHPDARVKTKCFDHVEHTYLICALSVGQSFRGCEGQRDEGAFSADQQQPACFVVTAVVNNPNKPGTPFSV